MSIVLHDLELSGGIRPSPYCWRARFALEHKGLDYRTVPTSFGGISNIAGGGHKTVPVMEIPMNDSVQVVGDSWDIANHLENAYPDRPSLFGNDQGRSFALFVQNWCLHSVLRPMMKAIILDIYERVLPEDRENFRKVREQRLGMTLEDVAKGPLSERLAAAQTALESARAVLRGRPFLCGESPMHADYMLAGQLLWPRAVSPARMLEPGDPLVPWFERMLSLYGRIADESTRTWDGP